MQHKINKLINTVKLSISKMIKKQTQRVIKHNKIKGKIAMARKISNLIKLMNSNAKPNKIQTGIIEVEQNPAIL